MEAPHASYLYNVRIQNNKIKFDRKELLTAK